MFMLLMCMRTFPSDYCTEPILLQHLILVVSFPPPKKSVQTIGHKIVCFPCVPNVASVFLLCMDLEHWSLVRVNRACLLPRANGNTKGGELVCKLKTYRQTGIIMCPHNVHYTPLISDFKLHCARTQCHLGTCAILLTLTHPCSAMHTPNACTHTLAHDSHSIGLPWYVHQYFGPFIVCKLAFFQVLDLRAMWNPGCKAILRPIFQRHIFWLMNSSKEASNCMVHTLVL